MKRMSVMAVAVGLFFVFIGCGKISPTGPSEAVAANVTKSAVATEMGAATTPVLSLSPSQVTVNVGDDVVVEAVVENAVNLYGIAATIQFESSKLQFVRDEEGEFLKSTKNPTSMMSAIRLQEPNKWVAGVSSLGNVPGVNGSGTLFRITFKAIGSGQVELSFIETALRDSTNSDIKFEQRSTTITVR